MTETKSSVPFELCKPQPEDTRRIVKTESSVPFELCKPQPELR